MTDLEMTRLCAEEMGVWHCPDTDTDFVGKPIQAVLSMYDPLHDDAQAMALVKKFEMSIRKFGSTGGWQAWINWSEPLSFSNDLNYAIVECVAKMRAASPKAGEQR